MLFVRAARGAVLLQTQTVFHVLLVLRGLIVALLAVNARHRQFRLIFRCHNVLPKGKAPDEVRTRDLFLTKEVLYH